MMKTLHSYWAYIVLAVLIFTVINAILGLVQKKEFTHKEFRLGLFSLITTHIQFLLGFFTQHIFSTIGQWMSETISSSLGEFFTHSGAVLVGSVELIASVLLLAASFMWVLNSAKITKSASCYQTIYFFSGLLSSAIMFGAAFFHLFTPLGIEVIHEGKNDGGSLFYAAVSILFLGLVLAFLNRPTKTQ